jgi:hypothetical protein
MERITVVLPLDEDDARPRPLAVGVPALDDVCIGVVDNELWSSMRVVVAALEAELRAQGVRAIEATPFDHLSPEFAEQQRALVPFGARVAGAFAGLGN